MQNTVACTLSTDFIFNYLLFFIVYIYTAPNAHVACVIHFYDDSNIEQTIDGHKSTEIIQTETNIRNPHAIHEHVTIISIYNSRKEKNTKLFEREKKRNSREFYYC